MHYPFPLHRLGLFKDRLPPGSFPEAEAWAAECLSLPLYPELTPELRGQVVAGFAAAMDASRVTR